MKTTKLRAQVAQAIAGVRNDLEPRTDPSLIDKGLRFPHDHAHDELDCVELLPDKVAAVAMTLQFPIFHSACVGGYFEVVNAFLDAKFPPDTYPCTSDEDDETPITWVVRDRVDGQYTGAKGDDTHLDMMRLLYARGGYVREDAPRLLVEAAVAEDADLCALLLSFGAERAEAEEIADEEHDGDLLREFLDSLEASA
jgi:hypothetical protein